MVLALRTLKIIQLSSGLQGSDKKSTIVQIGVSPCVMHHFSDWFQEFFFIFHFQQFRDDVS